MYHNTTKKELEIAKLGENILRVNAKEVLDVFENKIQNLISKMLYTVEKSKGVGIAAPQVFQSLQILIVSSKPNNRYQNAPHMTPTVIINPKIIETSIGKNKDWEGCLSIPGIRAMIPRYDTIKVEYFNEKNEKKSELFEGFIARVFQHEYDHLNGLVFLDNIESTKDIISEEMYFKLIKE